MLRINSLQDTNSRSFPRLGRYFLTRAYMLYNDDAGSFTIWEANQTSTEPDIAAVDSDGEVSTKTFCSDEQLTTQTGTDDNSNNGGGGGNWGPSASATTSPDGGGLSSGGKAGVGVGVAVGVLAVAGAAALWFLRRRNRSQAAEAVTAAELSSTPLKPAELQAGGWKPDDEGSPASGQFHHQVPQELPATQDSQPVWELPASEPPAR